MCTMAELINRPEYLNQLIQNRNVDLVKIITGIRRCGKSSLLDLFHQYLTDINVADANIIHMNLVLRYRNLSDCLAFYDYVSERIPKDGKTYLIFGELQAVEHWEKAIESFRLDFVPILREYRFNEMRSNQALEGIYSTVVLRNILQRNHQADQEMLHKIILFYVLTLAASLLRTVSEMSYPMRAIFRLAKEKMSQARQWINTFPCCAARSSSTPLADMTSKADSY